MAGFPYKDKYNINDLRQAYQDYNNGSINENTLNYINARYQGYEPKGQYSYSVSNNKIVDSNLPGYSYKTSTAYDDAMNGAYMKNGKMYYDGIDQTNRPISIDPNTNKLTSGLAKPPLGDTFDLNGSKYIAYNGTQDQLTKLGLTKDNLVTIGKQQYIKQDPTFMQKYGQGIQLGLGTAQLGLGIGNFLENRATAKKQRALLSEQLKEAKEEYSRIKQTRAKLNASY